MHKEENNITEYSYTGDTGDAQAAVYRLCPGVEVAYLSVHMEELDFSLFDEEDRRNCAFIHYCRAGRIEQETEHAFFHLMPGDCFIAFGETPGNTFRLPLGHYQGIRIRIDPDTLQSPLMAYWESCGCSPRDTLGHICGGMSHTVVRGSGAVRQFFEDLYGAAPAQRPEYLREKCRNCFTG